MDAYATMSTQVFSAFAHFEERHREYERARVIYKVRFRLLCLSVCSCAVPLVPPSFLSVMGLAPVCSVVPSLFSFYGGGGLLAVPKPLPATRL